MQGKGFAVVAQEIKSLSESSKDTALDSNKNKKEIVDAMDKLAEESNHLMEIVDEVNERISNLAASKDSFMLLQKSTTVTIAALILLLSSALELK